MSSNTPPHQGAKATNSIQYKTLCSSFIHHHIIYIWTGILLCLALIHIPILDLVEGSNVDGLDKVLVLLDLLGQQIDGHLLVLDDAHDLQLVDSVSHGHQLGSSPQQTVHLDLADQQLHLLHVGLIVPGLDVHQHGALGDQGGLLRLLGIVSLDALGLDAGLLSGLLLILRSEQVDVIISLGGGGLGAGHLGHSGSSPLCLLRGGEGGNVAVPTGSVDQVSSRGLAQGVEHGGIGLGGLETAMLKMIRKMVTLVQLLKSQLSLLLRISQDSPDDVAVLGQEVVQLLDTGRGFNISERHICGFLYFLTFSPRAQISKTSKIVGECMRLSI